MHMCHCFLAGSACRWGSYFVSGEEGECGAGLQRAWPLQLQPLSCQQLLQWRLGQLLLHLPQRSVCTACSQADYIFQAWKAAKSLFFCLCWSLCRLLWQQLHWRVLTEPLWTWVKVHQEAKLLSRLQLWLCQKLLRPILREKVAVHIYLKLISKDMYDALHVSFLYR